MRRPKTITAVEVAQTPDHDGAVTPGYGDGFASDSEILGVANATVTITPGLVTAIPLAFSEIVFNNSGQLVGTTFSNLNAGYNSQNFNDQRMTVTGGMAQYAAFYDNISDQSTNFINASPGSALFADYNASPEPVTLTSSSTSITVATIPRVAATPDISGSTYTYAATAIAPGEADIWGNTSIFFGMKFSGTFGASDYRDALK